MTLNREAKMIDTNKIESIRKTTKGISSDLTRAYNKLTIPFLVAYFIQFCEWCREGELAFFDGDLDINQGDPEKPELKTTITWKRDAKTNKLPKGTELKWFQYLFPEIPTEREEYRNNALYRTLSRTIHKPAEEKVGKIEYHREAKGKVSATAAKVPDIVDEHNVIQPTSILEIDAILQSPITQALLRTVAFYKATTKKPSPLLDFAASLQMSQGWKDALAAKQDEYIKAQEAAIAAAKKEKEQNSVENVA
jgi:hypothetical protein